MKIVHFILEQKFLAGSGPSSGRLEKSVPDPVKKGSHCDTLPLKVQPINYEDVQKVVLFSRDLLNREPIINVRERMNFIIS